MNKKFEVAVIVVTYNRSNMIMKTLYSMAQQSISTIFIIDNASSDDTALVIDEFKKSCDLDVVYKNTGKNLGGAGGFRFGCELAINYNKKFTHFWLTDDDVYYKDDCLENLIAVAQGDKVAQPMRWYEDGTSAEYSSELIDLKSKFRLGFKGKDVKDTLLISQSEPFNLQSIPFEGLLVPQKILSVVGLPDENYFLFSDDTDFAIRCFSYGFEIKCVPKARAFRMIRNLKKNRIPKTWRHYFMYRNFAQIHKRYGKNWFVKNRPYMILILVFFVCIVSFNFKGANIAYCAMRDGMSKQFPLDKRFIP